MLTSVCSHPGVVGPAGGAGGRRASPEFPSGLVPGRGAGHERGRIPGAGGGSAAGGRPPGGGVRVPRPGWDRPPPLPTGEASGGGASGGSGWGLRGAGPHWGRVSGVGSQGVGLHGVLITGKVAGTGLQGAGPGLILLRLSLQRLFAASTGLRYFGRSLHALLDANGDGLVDLAVGALGAAAIVW